MVLRHVRPYSQLQDAWPAVSAACLDDAQQAHAEVADALRMVRASCTPTFERVTLQSTSLPLTSGAVQAAMVDVFRSRGHLAAPLDPLGRATRGPWFAEAPERCTSSALCGPGLFSPADRDRALTASFSVRSLCRGVTGSSTVGRACLARGPTPMYLKTLCLQEGVRVACAAGRLLHRLASRAQGCVCRAAAQPAGQLGSRTVRAPCGCASAKDESAG